MIDPNAVREFLSHRRLAVVGASPDPRKFGNTVYKELRGHGYDVVPVNPNAEEVEGDRCFAELALVPGDVEGAILVVAADRAVGAVRECLALGVPRVWLFKGLGGPGAVSDEAVALCEANGVEVIPGACPLMFLEPVGWFHRVHRGMRRLNHSLGKAA